MRNKKKTIFWQKQIDDLKNRLFIVMESLQEVNDVVEDLEPRENAKASI